MATGDKPLGKGLLQRGYVCTCVEKPPKLFECALCKLILREPQLTTCCGRNACLPCVGGQGSRNVCPFGCGSILTTVLNRHLRNEIFGLKVVCSFASRGCKWMGKLEQLESHEKSDCNFADIVCPRGCGVQFPRHRSSVHSEVCERVVIACPNQCGETLERKFVAVHLKYRCGLMDVNCPFDRDGCKARIKRKDVTSHLKTRLDSHLAMVMRKSSTAEQEWKQTKQELISEQEHALQQRKIEIETLCEKIPEMQLEVQTLQHRLEAAEKEIGRLREMRRKFNENFQGVIAAEDVETRMYREGVAELNMLAREKCLGPPFPKYANHLSRTTPQTRDVHIPPITITMGNFEQLKSDEVMWYSPPFYSHREGYKMCLEVHPNGYGTSYAKSLSIFVALVKGEFDSFLEWPFSGSVTVTVLNQRKPEFHEMHTISFDHRSGVSERQRVINGYVSHNGRGKYHFISHRLLYPRSLFPERQYLKNNCLKISVSEIVVN